MKRPDKTERRKKTADEAVPLSFDEALRKILKAPPQHKTATKEKKKS
jgi:hypothetical protein